MKKFFLAMTMVCLFLFCQNVSAETFFSEISGDKLLVTIKSDSGSKEVRTVPIVEFEGKKYIGIRKMSEACGADSLEWDGATKTISVSIAGRSILLTSDSPSVYINGTRHEFENNVIIVDGTSYAPVEARWIFTDESGNTAEQAALPEKLSPDGNLGTLSIENGDASDRIRLPVPRDFVVSDFILTNPDRLVIDARGLKIEGAVPSGSTFDGIRHFTDSKGMTRIVFELNDNYKYSIHSDNGETLIDISPDGIFTSVNQIIEFTNNKIIINTGNYAGYRISRSSDPFALEVFLPIKLSASDNTLRPEGNLITGVTASIVPEGTVLLIEMAAQNAFELEKLSDAFIVGIYEPVVKNIEYHNLDDKQYIGINGISGAENFSISKSSDGRRIEARIYDPKKSITSGQIYINDKKVKNIFVSRDGEYALVGIEAVKPLNPALVSNDKTMRIYLNESDYSGKLVVISAGHGGIDPGAVAGNIHEADINLSIAFKIQTELEKMGIETYMIRTDDTFVGIEERARIANSLKADLFLSIHCNTFDDPAFDGLMTLVHSGRLDYKNPNGFTAGTIVHAKLIEYTNAMDRGVRIRDKIVVLKNTNMPAVEIEAGFLTNPAELVKLLDDSYQWKIATGAAAGIGEVLDLMSD
ncbi:MAG: N-acetylmuramoyl-L-alanine amidase [Clostridia bacterium]|nr:N-acetylmuramoyl-L-alanine amidase [Clostridia bacterium]